MNDEKIISVETESGPHLIEPKVSSKNLVLAESGVNLKR